MLHLLGAATQSVDPMERARGGLCSVMSTVSIQDKTWVMHVAGRCESGELDGRQAHMAVQLPDLAGRKRQLLDAPGWIGGVA